MSTAISNEEKIRIRNLLFFTTPRLWPHWPFLPLVRRVKGQNEDCGVLFDVRKCLKQTGYSATVFLINYFLIPPSTEEFLKLPKEVFDRPEELFEAGWRVD